MGTLPPHLTPVTMRFSSLFALTFGLILLLSLLCPDTEAATVRGRKAVGSRRSPGSRTNARANFGKKRGRGGSRKGRRFKKSRNGRWEEGDMAMDAAVEEDAAADDSGAMEAAEVAGDIADVCEVIVFDRGEGTYR